MRSSDNPVTHYEHITGPWRYLLGEDFHYGYFQTEDESLEAATHNLTALMAEKAAIGRGMSVLDVGCGIGNPACFLAERYQCQVTGITTSATGVEESRRRAQQRGCADRVRFLVADGMDNGLPDTSFDRVWVLESSHLMPRKDALLAESARVLRPGGCLVLCDIILHRDLPLGEVLSRAQDFVHFHNAFGRAKTETLETYRRFAESAGLRVTQSIDLSERMRPTFAHWRLNLEKNGDEIRGVLGDEGMEHFRASCEVLPTFWEQRILGYGLMVAVKERGA
jgi:27-O-demethylrifamycin SV methyltransferase